MILGVIPARGGSKGVKGKNVRLVSGKPLVAHAVMCGLSCPSIEHLLVSTDSREIAQIGIKYGADVPFLRPHGLAQDATPMLPVLQHAVVEAERYYDKTLECIVLLDPTAPLRLAEDVENALEIYKKNDCDAVVSGNKAHRNPYFNMVEIENGYAKLVKETETVIGRRQDAPEVFDLNTVVWIFSRRALMDEQKRIPSCTLLYIVPAVRAIDLDSESDFEFLEFLLWQKNLGIVPNA